MERLEAILHVMIVKPLAWLLLWSWWLLCWCGRGIVHLAAWARQRWNRWHESREPEPQRQVRQVRHKVAA
jgi:hypothetical protein